MTTTRATLSTLLLSLLLLAACDLFGGQTKPPNDPPEEESLPGTIVFAALDEEQTYQLFTINADGSDLRQLTNMLPSEDAYYPSWSPDGDGIVFSSDKLATSIGPALWVMAADGSNQRVLHDFEPDNPDVPPLGGNWPQWSPDGTRVAFDLCLNCQIATNVDVWVFDTITNDLTQLTDHPGSDSHPRWSPDGTQIAFVSNRDYPRGAGRSGHDLYVMQADGANQRRLTETGYARTPIWHPNGNTIAFRSTDAPSHGLFQLNVQSGAVWQIAEPLSPTLILDPAVWSSDGRYLLVTAWTWNTNQQEYSLQIIDLATGEARSVFSTPRQILGVDWFTPAAH